MERIDFTKYKTIGDAINHAESLMAGCLESKIHAHNLLSTAIYDLPNRYDDKSAHKLGLLRDKVWNIEKQFGWNPKFTSQAGQDKVIFDTFFRNKKSTGFFIDIGAYDGKTASNSFFFEKFNNWQGIAFEPSKQQFIKLNKIRNCVCKNEAIGPVNTKVEFCEVVEGPTMMSGLKNSVYEKSLEIINNENLSKINTYDVEVLTFEMGVGDIKVIDYLSIDIEGGEEDLIKSIDYSFYDIKVISIENNYPNDINYLEFLSSKGFKFFNCYGHDEIYYNKNHF
jgi:FkbM family methyltransferase